jgi:hypothetical protein
VLGVLAFSKKYNTFGEMDRLNFCTVLMMVYDILKFSSYFVPFPVSVI